MSVRAKQVVAISFAIALALVTAVFAIWISVTVGDPRVGNPASTIITVGFIALLATLVGWRIYRDRNG